MGEGGVLGGAGCRLKGGTLHALTTLLGWACVTLGILRGADTHLMRPSRGQIRGWDVVKDFRQPHALHGDILLGESCRLYRLGS